MSKSTVRPSKNKPKKPYPDFPLFAHANGLWAKKIRGKHFYFGPWRDPDGALEKYLDEKDDHQAGRTPRVKVDGATIAFMANHFLTSKKHLLDTGEIQLRTFQEYFDFKNLE